MHPDLFELARRKIGLYAKTCCLFNVLVTFSRKIDAEFGPRTRRFATWWFRARNVLNLQKKHLNPDLSRPVQESGTWPGPVQWLARNPGPV